MGLREQKKEQQRSEILEAALALFRERGYDETRVHDIIERVGISEGTFFNYFPTKDSLLHEFAIDHIDLYRGILSYELEAKERSVAERIREVMRVAAQTIAQDREFQTVLYTRSNLFDSQGLLKEKTVRSYDLLTELFREGQERGEIRRDVEPLQLAETMTGIYHLTTINWLTGWLGEEAEGLEPRLLRAIDLFLDGCAPS
jgi:AcrR family transcriptional regulator